MDFKKLEEIKKRIVISLFSDDELMGVFVLKGGSALDIAYDYPNTRLSTDVDLSMPSDFSNHNLIYLKNKMKNSLEREFSNDYKVMDVKLQMRPQIRHRDLPIFWGGYELNFKLVPMPVVQRYGGNEEMLRKNAEEIIKGGKRNFKVEISIHEYCESMASIEIDGYNISVYTPELLIVEKVRSICQQMPDYLNRRNKTRRARDFYDIYLVMQNVKSINWGSFEFFELVRKSFKAKKVPLELLAKIGTKETRDFHAPDFRSVQDGFALKPNVVIFDFDFYFDYVVKLVAYLEPLWVK